MAWSNIGLPTNDLEKTVAFTQEARALRLRCVHGQRSRRGTGSLLQLERTGDRSLIKPAARPGGPGPVDHIERWTSRTWIRCLVLLRDGGYELLDDRGCGFFPFKRGARFSPIPSPNGEKVEFSQNSLEEESMFDIVALGEPDRP